MKKELKKSNKNEKPITYKEMLANHTKIITDILKRELYYQICFISQFIIDILMIALIIKK